MTTILSIVHLIFVAGRKMNEDSSYLLSAYSDPGAAVTLRFFYSINCQKHQND